MATERGFEPWLSGLNPLLRYGSDWRRQCYRTSLACGKGLRFPASTQSCAGRPPGANRRVRPLGVEQRWRTPWRVGMVEYHPSVVVLRGIRALAHVEPA